MKLSENMKSIITASLLFLSVVIIFPMSNLFGIVGITLMWKWTKWSKWVKIIISIPVILILIASILVLSYQVFLKPYKVSGNAMYPNYNNGAYLSVKIIQMSDVVDRGDVIIFFSPRDLERSLIKRVVGLPGEKVTINDGEIYINGQKLAESSYLKEDIKTYGGTFLQNEMELIIPSNEYFVLGDNRVESTDSRDLGFIKKEDIIGKVAFCYWNCN